MTQGLSEPSRLTSDKLVTSSSNSNLSHGWHSVSGENWKAQLLFRDEKPFYQLCPPLGPCMCALRVTMVTLWTGQESILLTLSLKHRTYWLFILIFLCVCEL